MDRPRILFVHHALYIPRLLSGALREKGLRADVLLFGRGEAADLTWGADFTFPPGWPATPRHLGFLPRALRDYDVFHFWARPWLVPILFRPGRWHLPWDLALLKAAGKRIVFQSDGCYPMIRPSVWEREVDPEICRVCRGTQGDTYGFCSDRHTDQLNRRIRRYADLYLGTGMDLDWERGAGYFFYPVDLERWRPDLPIPPEHRFRRRHPGSLLIFHAVGSHVIGNRGDIKGTSLVAAAVEDLRAEGHNVELMYVERCPNQVLRHYQAQADIVVDQLYLGGGGQNARECLALGKPVLTRVFPRQMAAFREAASPLEGVPFVPTDRHTLRDDLRRLVTDPDLRERIGRRSLEFARTVLAPRAAAARLLACYRRAFLREGVGEGGA